MRSVLSIRILVVAAAVLAGCSSNPSTQPAPDAPSVSADASSSPEPVTGTPQEARLDGTYTVKLLVRKSTFDSHPKKVQRGWVFVPKCSGDTGPCDSLLRGQVNFKSDRERTQAGAKEDFKVKMIQLGKTFGGRVTGTFASCDGKPNKDTWTFKVKVDDASDVGGEWVATEWSGTWTRNSSQSFCTPGNLEAVIRGSLNQKESNAEVE